MTTAVPDPRVGAVFAQPLHSALGIRLIDPDDLNQGTVMPVSELITTPGGTLHGGVTPVMLDVTCYLRLAGELADDKHAVTVSSSYSLIGAVPTGEEVRAVATLDRLGRSQAFLTARLTWGDRVVATAQIVKAIVDM